MILYLGIDPKRWPGQPVFHYPIIATKREPSAALDLSRLQWEQYTHVIFTSRSAVIHFWEIASFLSWKNKQLIAIGAATAEALAQKNHDPLVAEEATQEGVIALMSTMDLSAARVLLPRSKRSRHAIDRFFQDNQIPYTALDLYDVVFQKPQPQPDWKEIEEIVFTSPSTVEAFIALFGAIPAGKRLTAIGPVTQRALAQSLLGQ